MWKISFGQILNYCPKFTSQKQFSRPSIWRLARKVFIRSSNASKNCLRSRNICFPLWMSSINVVIKIVIASTLCWRSCSSTYTFILSFRNFDKIKKLTASRLIVTKKEKTVNELQNCTSEHYSASASFFWAFCGNQDWHSWFDPRLEPKAFNLACRCTVMKHRLVYAVKMYWNE